MSLHFKNLILQNYGIYDEAELDLDYEGVTLLTGRNIEASGEVGSNYCGKSLLVSAIPGLLYGSAPGVTAQKASAKHDAYARPQSGAHLALDLNGTHTEIERFRGSQKTLAMSIEHGGRNLEFDRATAAEKWLEENIPINDTLFYASSYLLGAKASPLIEGTTSAKFNFVCSLFGLDIYDGMKAYVGEERQAVRLRMSAVEERNRLLEEVSDKLDGLYAEFEAVPVSKDIDMDGCDDADSRVARIEEYMDTANSQTEELATAKEVIGLVNGMEECEVPAGVSLQELVVKRDGFRKEIENIEARINLMREFQQYALSDEVTAMLQEMADSGDDYEPTEFLEWADGEIAMLRARSQQLSESAKVMHDVFLGMAEEQGECPTCRKPLSRDEAGRLSEGMLEEMNAEVEKLRELQQDSGTAERHVRMEERVAEFKERMREAGDGGMLDDPTPQKFEEFRTGLLEGLAAAKMELEEVGRSIALMEKAGEYEYASRRLREIGMSFRQAEEVIAATDEDLLAAQSKELWRCRDIVIRIGELEAQEDRLLAESDEDLENEARILDVLFKVCGSDGIRRTRCESVLEHVMGTLNRNASFVFPEDVEFSYVVSASGIEILCNGSNIRTLSGAESRFFNILVTSSLLELIDDSKRTNIMVLDEMDAFSGGVLKRRFYTELVPILSTVVPHVIIVTPNPPDEDMAYGFRKVCAVRENGRARLEFE